MTTYYIDPSSSTNGNGLSTSTPFNSWASVTWTAGNTYLQKAGTKAYEQVSVGGSGTASSRILIGKYGSGKNPVVGLGTQYGMYLASRQYIDISNIDVESCSSHGFYIRTSGSTIKEITLTDCVSKNNVGNGFFLDGVVLTASLSNVTFTGCLAYNNGQHGYDTLGIINNIRWRYCKASKNGATTAGHGFSLHPFISNNIISGWTVVAGNVYQRTLSASETVQKVINRTDSVVLTKNSGAGTGIGTNEWDQSGTTLYINVGANPNTKTTAWKRASHGPFYYEYCESSFNYSNTPTSGEGHGFASDDMTSDVIYYGCISSDNQGAGFQCQWTDNITHYGCVALNNSLSNFRTTGYTNILRQINNTSIGSKQHGFFYDVPFSNVTNTNSYVYSNGIGYTGMYGIAAGTTGINCSYGWLYNNGSGSVNNVTNTNGISLDPSIYYNSNGRLKTKILSSGTLITNPAGSYGTYIQGVSLLNDRSRPGFTPIGAYQVGRV